MWPLQPRSGRPMCGIMNFDDKHEQIHNSMGKSRRSTLLDALYSFKTSHMYLKNFVMRCAMPCR